MQKTKKYLTMFLTAVMMLTLIFSGSGSPVVLAAKKKVTKTPTTAQVPKSKTVAKGYNITLKAPKNAILYYTLTTNGKTPKNPTVKSKKINKGKSKKITINKNTWLKAIAVRKNYTKSKVVSRTYKVKMVPQPTKPTPTPSPTPTYAPPISPASDFEYTVRLSVAEITKYIGSSADVVVPLTINGNKVAVSPTAFNNCNGLKTVTFLDETPSSYIHYNAGQAYQAAVPAQIIPGYMYRQFSHNEFIYGPYPIAGVYPIIGVKPYYIEYWVEEKIIPAKPEVLYIAPTPASGISETTFDGSEGIVIYAHQNALSKYKNMFKSHTVNPIISDNGLFNISVITPPNKVKYAQGYELDMSGLTLQAKNRDGKTEIITSGLVCSPMPNTLGKHRIFVEYNGKTAWFEVEVVEDYPVEIEIATLPDKLDYYELDKIDPTGLTLNATYFSGEVKTITSGFICETIHPQYNLSTNEFHVGGTQTVTVTFGECTATFDAKVTWLEIIDARLVNPPRLDYGNVNRGQAIDAYINGAEVEVLYNNGATRKVKADYGSNANFFPTNHWGLFAGSVLGKYTEEQTLWYSEELGSGEVYDKGFTIEITYNVVDYY